MLFLLCFKGNFMNKLILFLLPFFLVSCGGQGGEAPTQGSTSGDVNKLMKQLAEINFSCSESECAQNVAAIVLADDEQSICTGSFINDHQVITASNCFQKLDTRNCSKKMLVKTLSEQSLHCNRVDVFEDQGIAVVELKEKVSLKLPKFNIVGFEDRPYYSFWRVDKSHSDANEIVLKKGKYCKLSRKNIRFPYFRSGNSSYVLMKNCPIQLAGLGSLFVDENGDIVGLLRQGLSGTDNFDRYIYGRNRNKGNGMSIAVSSSCFLDKLDVQGVSDIPYYETCNIHRDNNTSYQRYIDVTDFFYYSDFPTNRSRVYKAIMVSGDNGDKEFYRVSYSSCMSDKFYTNLWSFGPMMSRNYEVYESNMHERKEVEPIVNIHNNIITVYTPDLKQILREEIDYCN